ncbi:MAG: hypothetical protein ABFS43_06315 [Thermodesulfobacteriota bacterium]
MNRMWTVILLIFSIAIAGCGGSSSGGNNSNPVTDPDVQTIGCTDNFGLDLFAAETDSALGLSWNNQGEFDASGGYQVRYGTVAEAYGVEETVDCTNLDCETTLTGLNNDTTYYVVVDSLDSLGQPTATSCEISATPHVLTFSDDMAVAPSASSQSVPKIASSWDGKPLFMGWIENGKFVISRSDDYGLSWSVPDAVWSLGGVESDPSLTFRRRVVQTNPDTGELEILVEPALFATFAVDGTVKFIRADFPDGPTGALSFTAPVDIGTGALPSTAAYADHVEVVYERGGGIWASSSSDGGLNFSAEQRVDNATGTMFSARPDVAIDPRNDDVFVAYHGQRGEGNTDIYLNFSIDGGVYYQEAEVRIDDDTGGGNQSNVSLSTDPRTGHVMATWEDRRSGSDVYFSRSIDGGNNWEANLNSGTGLIGDQFTPSAETDPGRNVFVLFIDTSAGQKPLFNRFNSLGSFDTPKEVSSVAGSAGSAAKTPAITIDKLGRAFVAWAENRDGPVDNVFFARGE